MANKKIKKITKKTLTKKTPKSASKLAGSKNSCFLKPAKKVSKAKKEVKQSKQLVTKNMFIGDIAIKYPKAVPIMFKYGMHCIGCGMTAYESLEQGCLAHDMSNEEIDKMVKEINKAVEK
jgi:hybrid cluster-associated redox disulfide protein